MKKILILVNHDVVIYNFRKELVWELLADGYEVYLSSPKGERIALLQERGVNYIPTTVDRHGTNVVGDAKLFRHYVAMMRSIQPDMVLTYTIKPNIYGGLAARICRIPYLVNITGLGTALEHDGILQKITTVLYKISMKKAKRIFFQNQENLDFFYKKRIGSETQYYLLPGSGVNLEEFQVLPYPDDEEIHFVFISRIMREKGIEEYLKTAEVIRNKYPKVYFHICGFCEEEYQDRLKQLQDQGTIIYHGMVSDVREVLKKVHGGVLPSYHEGMSNALLEAAACGRPVLASKIPGCQETFDDGVTGIGFASRSSDSLIKAIETFISLPYEEKKSMGLAARKKMEKEFDRKQVVDSYMNDIEAATNKR